MSDKENNWKTTDLNVDSLWLFDRRDNSGKHEYIYHGNFIPQIPNQLIRRYTNESDIVMELFSGSGTTLYECEKLHRNYIGFDINDEMNAYIKKRMEAVSTIRFALNTCDVTDEKKFSETTKKSLESLGFETKLKVDFLIAHPPYLDVVKFTDKKEDLSNITDCDLFIEKLMSGIKNAYQFLESGKYFVIVMGDVYKNSEVVPLSFYVMNAIKKNFNVKLKGIVVKNIEGNRGKLGSQGLWRYRALKSDYFLFKHEYIFVFKKVK